MNSFFHRPTISLSSLLLIFNGIELNCQFLGTINVLFSSSFISFSEKKDKLTKSFTAPPFHTYIIYRNSYLCKFQGFSKNTKYLCKVFFIRVRFAKEGVWARPMSFFQDVFQAIICQSFSSIFNIIACFFFNI